MNKELREALYTKGAAVTALTGGFWYLEADKAVYPYAVMSFVTNTNDRDSAVKFETYYLQINIYDTNGKNIETVKEAITTSFDDCESSMTLASWYVIDFSRQFAHAMKVDKVFQISIQYKIELQKK